MESYDCVVPLGDHPSHFTGKTPYHHVRTILRRLISRGWMENPTGWKEPGPGRDTIEYPLLRDGWRLNLDFPAIDCGRRPTSVRGHEMVRIEFLPEDMPSPPGTIPAQHFSSGFAPEFIWRA